MTHKGEVIKKALTAEYGEKKGTEVLYAGQNAGTFTGIDSAKLDAAVAKADAFNCMVPDSK